MSGRPPAAAVWQSVWAKPSRAAQSGTCGGLARLRGPFPSDCPATTRAATLKPQIARAAQAAVRKAWVTYAACNEGAGALESHASGLRSRTPRRNSPFSPPPANRRRRMLSAAQILASGKRQQATGNRQQATGNRPRQAGRKDPVIGCADGWGRTRAGTQAWRGWRLIIVNPSRLLGPSLQE